MGFPEAQKSFLLHISVKQDTQSEKLSDHMNVQFLTRWPPPRHIFVTLLVDEVGGIYS